MEKFFVFVIIMFIYIKNVSSKIRRQRAAQCKFRKMSIIKCVFFIYIKLKKKICKIFIINIVIFSYLKIF